jgi:predicted transcriptional regulator of viral defense system
MRHLIEGVAVPITNPARSIVDCFRYWGKVGLDVAMEGLRRRATINESRGIRFTLVETAHERAQMER